MKIALLRYVLRRKEIEMVPSEIERLIVSHASESSLVRYQEAVCGRVAGEVAGTIEDFSHSFARHGAGTADGDSGVVDALDEVARIIRTSTFPSEPVRFQER